MYGGKVMPAKAACLRTLFVAVHALACALVFGCTTSPDVSMSGLSVIGDSKGGRISGGVGPQQSIAMKLLTQHCDQFGRKGFVTQMDFDRGVLVFECREQKPRSTS